MDIIGLSGFDNAVAFKQSRFPNLDPRAYRIAQGFDSAAALLRDGQVDFAVAEERLLRRKATGAFPARSIQACLAHAQLRPADVHRIAHCFNYQPSPELLELDPFYRDQFAEVYDPCLLLNALESHFPGGDWVSKLVPVPHHLAHAASAFYQSGFQESLVLVSDGMGETESMTVFAADATGFEQLAHVPAFHSLGVLYSVFTLYLGFDFNMDEYKVMGLAPYGDQRKYFAEVMKLVHLKDDGTYLIPSFGLNQTVEERETHDGVLRALITRFGPPRAPGAEMEQRHKDIAAAIQAVLQTVQLHVLSHFARKTGLENLCMAGGVALNCTNNGVIQRSRLVKRVFVQPASGDDGAALGAALYVQHLNEPGTPAPAISAPLWGPAFEYDQLREALAHRTDVAAVDFESFQSLAMETAERLARGEIVGWFQGAMEFGPRALGNRSILADPRPLDMRDRVNMLVKKREGFRPFAPAVLAEAAAQYFQIEQGDEETYAHMLFVVPVRHEYRAKLPAITHIDGTARAQTVSCRTNPRFHQVLQAFEAQTGLPILLNTSFNVKGQPIVCSPTEAIDTFLDAQLDALVLGDFLVTRA